MKKKFLIMALMLTMISSVKAQYIKAYVSGGVVSAQVEGDELKGFKHFGPTAGVGAITTLGDKERFFLTLEANYSQKGIRQVSTSPDVLYFVKGFDLDYVDIPLAVHFKDPYGGVMIGGGLCYGRLVQQPHGGTIFYKKNFFMPDTSDLTFRKNDFSVFGDVTFPLWKGLKMNVRVQYSLIPVKKDWMFYDWRSFNNLRTFTNDCYNYSISARLMYVFGDESTSKKKHRR